MTQRPSAVAGRSSACARAADTEVRVRLDKWLWAARFFKTRALAVEAAEQGRVAVNGSAAKPAREVHVGDSIELRRAGDRCTVRVLGLATVRGPALRARELYAETDESERRRIAAAEERRLAAEPATAIDRGRPTKRDRRRLAEWRRWSASADDAPPD